MRRTAPQLATRLIKAETLDSLLARDRAEASADLRHPWFREELDEERFDELSRPGAKAGLWSVLWLAIAVAALAWGFVI